MSEQEPELTLLEPEDDASSRAEEDVAAPETETRTETGTDTYLGANPYAEAATAADEPISLAEFDQLTAERDQLRDRLARLQAEFENARKRAERERLEFRDYATGSVVERFLPVVDNFELALKSTGSEEQLRSGVELIVKQMEEILRQLQVLPIPAVGEAFDPRLHEAIGTVERLDLPDQHVAEEIRRGYRLRERLLRPAMVRVASNPQQANE